MKLSVFSIVVLSVFAGQASAQTNDKAALPPITAAQEKKAIEFFNLGNACGDTDARCRVDQFSKAIAVFPGFAEAYNNRGTAHQIKGSIDAALKDFTRAVEIEPAFVQGYYNRAVLAAAEKDFPNALKDFDKAIELSPDLIYAYIGRGNVHLKRGTYEDAVKNFDSAILLEPELSPIYHNRALAYDLMGEPEKAEADRKKSEMLRGQKP